MNNDQVLDRFIEIAQIVCQRLELLVNGDIDASLQSNLISLLFCANDLTNRRIISDENVDTEQHPIPALTIPQNIFFYVLFDPTDPNSVRSCTLADGLGDIYKSLKNGLLNLSLHPEQKWVIAWEWKNDFEFHWRRHLIDAIRYLVICRSEATNAGGIPAQR
jgi:hypothetical protein